MASVQRERCRVHLAAQIPRFEDDDEKHEKKHMPPYKLHHEQESKTKEFGVRIHNLQYGVCVHVPIFTDQNQLHDVASATQILKI